MLEHDHCAIYESDVIAEYLDEVYAHPPLMPADPEMRARARLLIRWGNDVLAPPVSQLEDSRLAGRPAREPARAEGLQYALQRTYGALETIARQLGNQPFVLGQFSLVDVFFSPFVVTLDRLGVRTDEMPPAVVRWIGRLRDRPSIAWEASRRIELLGLAEPGERASAANWGP